MMQLVAILCMKSNAVFAKKIRLNRIMGVTDAFKSNQRDAVMVLELKVLDFG